MNTAHKESLFSNKVSTGSRTYFFDVREAAGGAKYVVISESRKVGENFERKSIMIFEEGFTAFCEGVQKTAEFMKTAGR